MRHKKKDCSRLCISVDLLKNLMVTSGNRSRALALAAVALILTVFVLFMYEKPVTESSISTLSDKNILTSVVSRPTVEFTNGTNLIWQIPNSPKAVLFIAHGCTGKAANFWDRSSSCPNCVGLPEEKLIVLHALARRYAVVVVSSHGKCWDLVEEIKIVKWIIRWWVEKNNLDKFPLVALGASSGGYFVSKLALEMKFSSIVIMIAEGVFGHMSIPNHYPATLFVHMPKDHDRMKLIKKHMKMLRQQGIQVKEVKCVEFPLTRDLLSERIPGLDKSFSVKLFEIFRSMGFINGKGYMKKDGRAIPWKKVLQKKQLMPPNFELANHIQEELNLAYGYHEMTSLQSDDIFSWFESHLS